MTTPPQQGITAGHVCQVLNWEIQFLTIARNRFCPRTPVLHADGDSQPPQSDGGAGQDAGQAQAGRPTPLGKFWEAECPPPARAAGAEPIVWAAECPPPARPEAVDPCEALSACIHSLTELRTAFEAMPLDHVLG